MTEERPSAFEQASAGPQRGIVGEFAGFLKHNKKYWLIPLLVILLLMGALIILGGTAAAPFIYTLF